MKNTNQNIIDFLKSHPLLSRISAILNIAAMLATDYQTAEQLYNQAIN